MYQGFEAHIYSLLAIFESKALEFAKEARDMCQVSSWFPGAGTSRKTLDAHVAVCRLLLGDGAPGILAELDRAVKHLPLVSPAVPAWALSRFHADAGRQDQAQAYLKVVKRLLPYSTAFGDTRPQVQQ